MSKNKSKPYIFVTQQKLIDFCRYDIGWFELVGGTADDAYPTDGFDVQCEVDYPMQLEDLRTALTHFEEDNVPLDDFIFDWWYPVIVYFFHNLCLDDLFGPDPDAMTAIEVPSLPMNEDDVLVTILAVIAHSDLDKKLYKPLPLSRYLDLDSMINMIDLFLEDKDLPITERRYTIPQKTAFINHWDNNLLLNDAPDDIKALFRMFTDDLCENQVFEALKAKAYGCYGGNAVYKCDFALSAKLLEVLWRKFSFGYAANTLGYIYYYGRIDGKPDYEKAFFYFSVASNFNIVEAKYKIADMFMKGQYVLPNPPLAFQTYIKLYDETKFYFENGDLGCDFADCALRLGKALAELPNQRIRRYAVMLEADYAINKRIEKAYEYGDKKVQASIREELAKARVDLLMDRDYAHPFDRWRDVFTEFATDPIESFVSNHSDSVYNLKLRRMGNGRVRFTITREPAISGTDVHMSFSTQPWSEFCGMVSKLEFTIIENDEHSTLGSILGSDMKETNFDRLIIENPDGGQDSAAGRALGYKCFKFFSHGLLVCFAFVDKIFYNKPKDEFQED